MTTSADLPSQADFEAAIATFGDNANHGDMLGDGSLPETTYFGNIKAAIAHVEGYNLENLNNVTVVGSELPGDGLYLSGFGWVNIRARAYVGRVQANALYR